MPVDSSVRAALTAVVLSFVATFAGARDANAQLAPTGSHYATRSTDTGHDLVGANENGDYRASVPLDLPPARGGLPIPLEIASGTKGFGAAGLGWDIPLSYVLIDHSFAHRRPAYQPLAPATPRERIVAALPGRAADMIAQDSTHWIARNAADLTMTFVNNTYVVYDGGGLSYTFVMKPELANTGSNLWLLDEIDGPGGSSVKLYYTIATGVVAGASGETISIDLSEIDYNKHPTGSCFKNQVVLGYEWTASTAPALATSIVGDAVLVRKHKVEMIDLEARSTCGATPIRLLRYSLHYLTDPDTGLNRLSSVSVSGREDKPEGSSNILLGVYTYGAATSIDSNGAKSLQYLPDPDVSVPVPTGVPSAAGSTVQVSSGVYQPPTSGPIYASQQGLTDFTGDGRPDLVYPVNGKLQIARNQGQAGTAGTFMAVAPFTDSTMTRQVLDTRTSTAQRFAKVPVYSGNEEYIWRQAIDVNGDGRIDFIDAAEAPNKWIIYLNTPGPGPSGITWVRRAVDVTLWEQDFKSRGMPVPSNYLPLSHRISGRDHGYYQCFHWDYASSQYIQDDADRGGPHCLIDLNWKLPADGPERTYVDWELTDANGDGYPDFIFNLTPFQMVGTKPLKYSNEYVVFQQDIDLKHTGSADVYLALNVAGVALYNDMDQQDPFARGSLLIQNSACGVEEWAGLAVTGKETQELLCGLVDVNGDGLLDRVEDTKAYLGTGSGFKTMSIGLPAPVALHQSGYPDVCPSAAGGSFHTFQLNGLRDLTGDGIPDLVFRDPDNILSGATYVAIGTGVGFATPIAWDGGALSNEVEFCDGRMSYTTAGLFDITGDGKADVVSIDGSATSATLHVSELNGEGIRGGPQVGRLTSVNNGAGAVTSITYRSAKDDSSTQHQVPFPEIVVDHVETQGTYNLGGTLAGTSYAYGSISLFYDSALDVFRSTGYGRRVSIVRTATTPVSAPFSAEIVDRYPFDGSTTLTGDDPRYLRYQTVGQVRDVNVLAVGADDNAWALLTDNLGSDTRRMKGAHADFAGHMVREANTAATQDCIEIINPYDFEFSFAYNVGSKYNPCSVHGYSYVSDSTAWHGAAAPPSDANVQTHQSVLAVDPYGRPTSIFQDGDAHRTDDDVCVDITYATPALPGLHVPWVPASKKVWGCAKNNLTYAEEYFEYDGMSSGLVSQGLLTSHTVHRHRTDNGQDFRTIREFDISYDAAANPKSLTTTREDLAKRTSTVTFDEFGLAPVLVDVQGSGLPDIAVTNSIDPLTEQVLASTDANGTTRGATFDAFGRGIYETIQPKGGATGIMSATTYIGFETPGAVRQVQTKTFVDPVPQTDVGISEGRVATTYLDELARPQRTELQLGDDYANQILIIGSRAYDPLGRVFWEEDPHPSTQDGKTAYGTTQYFNQDGTLDVAIRGMGAQLYSLIPDASVEKFPTVYSHTFAGYQETTLTQTADALTATSPQFGVSHQTVLTATGRELSRSTWQSSTRLEYAELAHDRLGQLTGMTRYQDATTPAVPVAWTWQLDDVGDVLGLTEPSSLPQTRTYSDWGELKQIHWGAITSPPSGPDIFYTYDALGRVTHSEEQSSGVVDPDTVLNYGYDTPRTSPIADNLYTLGRLSYAASPTSETRFGYDAVGNVNASTFIDAADGSTYVQQDSYHADGSKAFIELALPDASYVPERMDYEYDTAGRLRWMWFNDGTNTQELYSATDIDVWGRLRAATLGPNSFNALYADTGRRLPKFASVKAGTQSRSFTFNSFDAIGRELSKTVSSPRFSGTEAYTYAARGMLGTLARTQGSTTTSSWNFAYDSLGNAKQLIDNIGTKDAAMTYTSADHDRVCSVAYGGNPAGPICTFRYDNFGNVTVEPNRSGSTTLAFFNSGGVRSLANSAGYRAAFHYGAFGERESLDITSSSSTSRSEHAYGGLIAKRAQKSAAGSTSYISRTFPGDSFVLSRRGPKGPWVTEYSDGNGTRFTADDAGTFAQDVDYGPLGEATSTGAQLGTPEYTSNQWNDGDLLDGFGLVQVGARVYDPVIGRFLSRDPLVVPRTAATTNPYAFAFNDPINASDPSGMDPDPCAGNQLCIWTSYGASSSSGSAAALGVWAADALFSWGSEPPASLSNQQDLQTYFAAFDARLGERQERYDYNHALGVIDNVFGSDPIGDVEGYAAYTNDVADGFADGMWDMGAGLVNMGRHPLQTLEGFGHMAAHPWETTQRIANGVYDTGKAIVNGDGHALGKAGAFAFGPGAIGKALGVAGKAAGIAKAATAVGDVAEVDRVSAYEVGTYDTLKTRSRVGDELDIHHAGQAHAMEQIVPGYERATGPSIALPSGEHALIPNLRGAVTMSPRTLLARDIWNLKAYTSAPSSSLQQLIQLNKTMYPGAFAR